MYLTKKKRSRNLKRSHQKRSSKFQKAKLTKRKVVNAKKRNLTKNANRSYNKQIGGNPKKNENCTLNLKVNPSTEEGSIYVGETSTYVFNINSQSESCLPYQQLKKNHNLYSTQPQSNTNRTYEIPSSVSAPNSTLNSKHIYAVPDSIYVLPKNYFMHQAAKNNQEIIHNIQSILGDIKSLNSESKKTLSQTLSKTINQILGSTENENSGNIQKKIWEKAIKLNNGFIMFLNQIPVSSNKNKQTNLMQLIDNLPSTITINGNIYGKSSDYTNPKIPTAKYIKGEIPHTEINPKNPPPRVNVVEV